MAHQPPNHKIEILTCQEVMSPNVIAVEPELSLSELCRVLTQDDISGAPVVDRSGKLIGMISKTDVLRALLSGRDAPGLPSSTLHSLGLADTMAGMAEDSEEEAFGQVGDLMTTDVATVTPGTSIVAAARLMSAKRIHRLAVVDVDRLVGIITSLDLLQHFGD